MARSNTCILVAIVLLADAAIAQQRLLKEVYGVGVVGNCCTHGAGVLGTFKARPDMRVVAACETDPRRAKELSDVLGRPLAASWDAVIDDPAVDIVAITCDPSEKAAVAEKAAAAGKAIFMNKPLCDSLDAARRIQRAVREQKAWFVHDIPMVRSIPAYARLLEEVKSDKHGKLMGYHHFFGMNFAPDFDLAASWPERLDPPEKSGGGEMTNMGCYAIDYAIALFGKPQAVTARWRKLWNVYQQADVEHFGQIVLDYGDVLAFLEVGKQQLSGERRHSNCLTIKVEGATTVSSVDQLLAALRDGKPPTASLDNAVDATEVLMAAYRSILEKRTIPLPLHDGSNPLQHRKP